VDETETTPKPETKTELRLMVMVFANRRTLLKMHSDNNPDAKAANPSAWLVRGPSHRTQHYGEQRSFVVAR
jgi:hypothetical protein